MLLFDNFLANELNKYILVRADVVGEDILFENPDSHVYDCNYYISGTDSTYTSSDKLSDIKKPLQCSDKHLLYIYVRK